jgi:hypothetical protein
MTLLYIYTGRFCIFESYVTVDSDCFYQVDVHTNARVGAQLNKRHARSAQISFLVLGYPPTSPFLYMFHFTVRYSPLAMSWSFVPYLFYALKFRKRDVVHIALSAQRFSVSRDTRVVCTAVTALAKELLSLHLRVEYNSVPSVLR